MSPFVNRRILLGKETVALYENVQEFVVAEVDGEVVGCGALHVMWEDLGEVRSVAVSPDHGGQGIGARIVDELGRRARDLGLSRLFCLTFEVNFFARLGFEPIGEHVVAPDVYAQLVRSPDEGIAEFLDLALTYALLNVIGTIAVLKYFRRGDLGDAGDPLTEDTR